MKTHQIITVKVIIQRKAYIGNRSASQRALEAGPNQVFKTEKWYADMGVIANVGKVIKYKRGCQGSGVNQNYNNRQHGKQQGFMPGSPPDY